MAVIGSLQAFSDPSWTCWLDGNLLLSANITMNLTLNKIEICPFTDILPSAIPSHNLTVVASGTADGPFLFDEIIYAPDDSTILDNATVEVDAFDSQIQYDSGWNESATGTQTSVPGASMTFDFVGTLHS